MKTILSDRLDRLIKSTNENIEKMRLRIEEIKNLQQNVMALDFIERREFMKVSREIFKRILDLENQPFSAGNHTQFITK